MNCLTCGKEMQKGEVQTGYLSSSVLKTGEPAVWIPEAECKKIVPKTSVSISVYGEGYYCETCKQVVAFFKERGADFWQ